MQVRNSAAIANLNNGFWAFSNGSAVEMNLENSRTSQNATAGVRSENAAAIVRLTDVTITNNGLLGIQSAASGQVLSFGNNRNAGQPTNGAPTAPILPQ